MTVSGMPQNCPSMSNKTYHSHKSPTKFQQLDIGEPKNPDGLNFIGMHGACQTHTDRIEHSPKHSSQGYLYSKLQPENDRALTTRLWARLHKAYFTFSVLARLCSHMCEARTTVNRKKPESVAYSV